MIFDGSQPSLIRSASFYDGRRRRLWLSRRWELGKPELLVVGLNPSMADENDDDATIRILIGFGRRWEFGAFTIVNLFDWIATHPKDLAESLTPEGDPENIARIKILAAGATEILCCWGDGGSIRGRSAAVLQSLWPHREKLVCLGKTRAGHPKHPLRQSYETPRVPLIARAA